MEPKWLEDKTHGDHLESLRGRVGFEFERVDKLVGIRRKPG
jgi:hypothetical protein